MAVNLVVNHEEGRVLAGRRRGQRYVGRVLLPVRPGDTRPRQRDPHGVRQPGWGSGGSAASSTALPDPGHVQRRSRGRWSATRRCAGGCASATTTCSGTATTGTARTPGRGTMTREQERAEIHDGRRVDPAHDRPADQGLQMVRSFPTVHTGNCWSRTAASCTTPTPTTTSSVLRDDARAALPGRALHQGAQRRPLPDRPTYASPRHFFESLKLTLDYLLEEAQGGLGNWLMSVGVHSRWSGQPGRASALQRLHQYARWGCDDVSLHAPDRRRGVLGDATYPPRAETDGSRVSQLRRPRRRRAPPASALQARAPRAWARRRSAGSCTGPPGAQYLLDRAGLHHRAVPEHHDGLGDAGRMSARLWVMKIIAMRRSALDGRGAVPR